MENYYKFFKDEVVDEEMTEDEPEPLAIALKEVIGDGSEIKKLLLAASEEGLGYLVSYEGPVSRDPSLALDDIDEDFDTTEYPAYTLVGRDLFTAESSDIQEADS